MYFYLNEPTNIAHFKYNSKKNKGLLRKLAFISLIFMKMLHDMQYLEFSLRSGKDISAPCLINFEKVNHIGNDFQFLF